MKKRHTGKTGKWGSRVQSMCFFPCFEQLSAECALSLHWRRQQCQMRGHLQQYPASESFSKWHVLDYHCSWKKQTPASNIVKRWRGFCIVEYHLQTTGLESWVTQLSLVMVAWDGKCMNKTNNWYVNGLIRTRFLDQNESLENQLN